MTKKTKSKPKPSKPIYTADSGNQTPPTPPKPGGKR